MNFTAKDQMFSITSEEICSDDCAAQHIYTPTFGQRVEGLALCDSGKVLGSALSNNNLVFVYRKRPNTSAFEVSPYCVLRGHDLGYPHDLAFSLNDDGQLLVVAQRSNSILVYEKNADDSYGPNPIFKISGVETELYHTDGVAFLPPHGIFIAACNWKTHKVNFYRRDLANKTPGFDLKPCFVIEGNSIVNPGGLAFSNDGQWLATANHGNHTVSVFQRVSKDLESAPEFYTQPTVIIQDDSLRHPHSLAFTPKSNHLVVTNAGANYVNLYRRVKQAKSGTEIVSWSQTPTQQLHLGVEEVFSMVNTSNPAEGGPKGIAIENGTLVISRTESGTSLYPCQEHGEGLALQTRHDYEPQALPKKRGDFFVEQRSAYDYIVYPNNCASLRINEFDKQVWGMCDGDHTVGAIISELQNVYPTQGSVSDDVQRALVDLHRAQVIGIQI